MKFLTNGMADIYDHTGNIIATKHLKQSFNPEELLIDLNRAIKLKNISEYFKFFKTHPKIIKLFKTKGGTIFRKFTKSKNIVYIHFINANSITKVQTYYQPCDNAF